jgi:hypothetical protein
VGWVKGRDGRWLAFDTARLENSIETAAESVGQPDWWLAGSIAAAVRLFVCEASPEHTNSADEIEEIVESVLSMLGYEEIARAYGLKQHRAEIRLDEMTYNAGAALELDFFQRLDAALAAAAEAQARLVQMRGLRACVMHLRGARRWSAGCRQLAEDIVSYVRARAARASFAGVQHSLSLAVLE